MLMTSPNPFIIILVVGIDSETDNKELKATFRSDSYTLHKVFPNKLVSPMMVEKV